MERILVAILYEMVALIFLTGLIKRVGRRKHLEKTYDWLFFLKFSLICVFVIQVGFVILVSAMFRKQHSLAVGLTTLIGIPMLLLLLMYMMLGFAREFRAIPNLICRLEKMTPAERETELENLPSEIFCQLPGDYRFVTKKTADGR